MNTNSLDARAFATGTAVASGLLTLVCFAGYALAGRPDPWMTLFAGSGPSVLGWIVGIAEMVIVGGAFGWIVAALYNRLARPAVAR